MALQEGVLPPDYASDVRDDSTQSSLEPFRTLGDYDWPSSSVDRGFKHAVGLLKKRLHIAGSDEIEGIDLSRLVSAERDLLDAIVAPPANEPLIAELELSLHEWLMDGAGNGGAANTRAIVLPPGDDENFLRTWALEHGFHTIDAPGREALELPGDFPDGDDTGVKPIVVPRLEEWFLRHDSGLYAIRELMRRIDDSGGKWLVGCNSWAWQFLDVSCGIESLFSDPLTFAAFDGARLHHWLKRLSHGRDGSKLRFRSARSGDDVFADDFGRSEKNTNAMTELAESSLGIPWVAWNLWRASLRTSQSGGSATDTSGTGHDGNMDMTPDEAGEQTIWVTGLPAFSLPDRRDQEALLVLHSLLIHGSLCEAEVHLTTPVSRHTQVLSALVRSGTVRRVNGSYSCLPAAYPAIRNALAAAGFHMDVL